MLATSLRSLPDHGAFDQGRNEAMKILLSSFICIMFCGCATYRFTEPWPPQAEDDSDWLAQGISTYIGEEYCMTRVTRSELRRSPDWEPQNNPCPMSVENAISHANTWIRANMPEKAWRFHQLTLHYVIGLKWYYSVSFREEQDFEKNNSWSVPIVVLFNGTVKGPERVVVKKDSDSDSFQYFEPLK